MQGIDEKEIQRIKEELDNCQRPLFLFDDDADGLCSFLLLYRYKREGQGVIVKRSSLDIVFKDKVESYGADKVFILDVPKVEEEFVRALSIPVIWIDHHTTKDLPVKLYVNPRVKDPDAYVPVSAICYEVVKQDIWISAIGCIADAYPPPFLEQLRKEYPALLPVISDSVLDVRYDSPLGTLVRIISFVLKDNISKINAIMKIMTRLDDPLKLLNNETSDAHFIHKSFKKIENLYGRLMEKALRQFEQQKNQTILYFEYGHIGISVTTELANELFYKFPDKLIIVAREKEGNLRMSLRYSQDLPALLQPVLEKINSIGGGHLHACGASIKTEEREFFLKELENALST